MKIYIGMSAGVGKDLPGMLQRGDKPLLRMGRRKDRFYRDPINRKGLNSNCRDGPIPPEEKNVFIGKGTGTNWRYRRCPNLHPDMVVMMNEPIPISLCGSYQ